MDSKDNNDRQQLSVSQVRTKSGIPTQTLRYYEDIGLIKHSGRTAGNFRLFDPYILDRLAFIKRFQTIKLSLEEIRECLQIYDGGYFYYDGLLQDKLEAKITEIDQKIEELKKLKAEIKEMLIAVNPANEEQDRDAENITCERMKIGE